MRNFLRHLGALFLILCCASAAAEVTLDPAAQAWLSGKPVVRIGIIADNAPYSTVHAGRLEGFSIDVLEEISARTGLRFDYKAGSWPEIYAAFVRGEIDAIDEISLREDRKPFTLFTEPYHHRQTVVMQDMNRRLPPISSLEDLKPHRVGIVKNIFYKSTLERHGLQLSEYDALPNLIRALAFGWVDAIVGPEVTLAYLARGEGFNQIGVAGRVAMDGFELEDFRIGVRREKPEAHRVIAAGLAAIPPARMQEMLAVWQEFGGRRNREIQHFQLSREQTDYLRRLGPIRVGIMRDYAPFSFADGGKTQGLAIDILGRIQDLTGLTVTPVVDRWPVLIELLRRGEIDVLTNISRQPDRLAFTRFTDPYHVIPNVAFTRDRNFRLTDPPDFGQRKIGIGEGIFYEKALRERFGKQVVTYGAQDAMFRALADGSVDVVIASLHNGNHWVRELGLANVTIAGELILPDFSGEDLRFGMRPGLAPLVGIFDSALAAITPTERRSIENRWLGASYRENSGAPQALSEGEKSWLRQHGPLKVCTDPDWMPIEALNGGRHAGIAADYLERMSQQFDIAYEIVPTNTWATSLQAVQERRCDLLTMAVQTPQQSIHLNFTAPYYTTPNVLLARIETPFVEGLDAFAGRQVGIVRGHAIADQLRSRYPQLELVEVDNEKEGLRELQRGRLEGYIGTLGTVNYHLRELGFADIKVVSRIPVDSKLSLATRNDLPELFSIAEKMVASLSDADRQRIESRWQTIRIEPGIDTALLWRWGSIIFVALALLILWNRKLGSLNRQLAEANQKLAQLNITDPLTGIGNRQFFEQEFAREFSRCQRNAQTFTTAMIDIDHFKKINDSLGHAAGDHCLVELARCLQQHLRRQTDNIARIGGEEFVAFMSGDTREEVLAHFEALRSDISALQITWEGQPITFTISIGLVHGIPEQPDNPAAWLRQADQALYRAKAAGRNRLDAEPPANA